jgi:Fur family ferric uptake transcriptional regulator
VQTPAGLFSNFAKRILTPSKYLTSMPTRAARSFQERFGDFLQSRGMRNTRQRDDILLIVVAQQGPFDAEQLLAQLPLSGSRTRASRPTVYRTLSELVDAGLVRKFELNGRSLYAVDTGSEPVEHLYCTDCQQFQPIRIPELAELRSRVACEQLFQVLNHRLVIEGVCQACRQKKRRERKRVDLI